MFFDHSNSASSPFCTLAEPQLFATIAVSLNHRFCSVRVLKKLIPGDKTTVRKHKQCLTKQTSKFEGDESEKQIN
jgi:hypothetical protein